MTESKVTSAKEFRQKSQKASEGELVTLPSGAVVKLRKPSLTGLLKKGLVPAHLLSVAMGSGEDKKLTADDLKKGVELTDFILMEAFVEPKLVRENPTEDEICLDDLTDEDRFHVQAYAQGGASDLNSFRKE
jgi:hypothetical protein